LNSVRRQLLKMSSYLTNPNGTQQVPGMSIRRATPGLRAKG